MKSLIITASTALILSLSSIAMADDDAFVGVYDSAIVQVQDGDDLEQKAVMALVSDDFGGDASIIVRRSLIVQGQTGDDSVQKAQMAIVGCDC